MANTFTLIQSQTLSSNAVSLDFTSIPQTYTDLVLYASSRNITNQEQWLSIGFNNVTTNYSNIIMWYDAGTLRGAAPSNQPPLALALTDLNSSSNTWSNNQLYIFNYASSVGKSYTGWGAQANTTSANSFWGFSGNKWANTAAITTLNITTRVAPSVAISSGSTFYLYGIKNT